ncbi:hypothetical protein F5X99DRAFT_303830 [Biscogniauxia marginata]|nr:hypothetical protein F5X99DRAFT_303830 [Biscogniauxia marginata]
MEAMTLGQLIEFICYNGDPKFSWPQKDVASLYSGLVSAPATLPTGQPTRVPLGFYTYPYRITLMGSITSPLRPLPRKAVETLRGLGKLDRARMRHDTRMRVMLSNQALEKAKKARRSAAFGRGKTVAAATSLSEKAGTATYPQQGPVATVSFPCRPGFNLELKAVWVPAGEGRAAGDSLRDNIAAPSKLAFAPKVHIQGSLESTEYVPVEVKREDADGDDGSPMGCEATSSSQAVSDVCPPLPLSPLRYILASLS